MDDISVLEELGFQEISRKTHIEVKFLKHMVNKEFSQLNRINTLGFIKILRREFNLDLTNWVQEYEEYLKNNLKEETQGEGLVIQQAPPRKKNIKWVYILLFFTCLGCIVWYFDGIKYASELKNKWLEDKNASFTSAPIVKETKEKLDALEQESAEQTINLTDNNTQASSSTIEKLAVEQPITQQPIQENITNTANTQEFKPNMAENTVIQNEDNTSLVSKNIQQSTKKEENIQTTKESSLPYEITKLTIKPNKKIWVGIINLENKQRKARLRNKNIDLDISASQLLVVGHGDFIFDLGNGNTLAPSAKLHSYYHIVNKTIIPISKKDFKKLNGGKNW